ncbi:MAG: F0F1 ATP synthase subunit alpha, partial [Cyanobacteria bacterium J06555_13]
YSQFQELESFARFGTRLDDASQTTLARGQRIREVLKQQQYHPIPVPVQIAFLRLLNNGDLDHYLVEFIATLETQLIQHLSERLPEICSRIQSGRPLSDPEQQSLLTIAQTIQADTLSLVS